MLVRLQPPAPMANILIVFGIALTGNISICTVLEFILSGPLYWIVSFILCFMWTQHVRKSFAAPLQGEKK